ncbi:MAG: dihydroorotate dehydrogenase B catalytic subunit [Candidatus Melainabacteria bacterium GWF2_37_15]|nr:MAG: dihydroorotate dehydrogenase B catalytic subunit [Candidatus Melainabacteria bacterium GWF2_37_15]
MGMKVKIGSLILQNPIITASGTFGYNTEYKDFMDLTKIGALITKGITLHPRQGNPQPRIKEVPNGMINSIGLENVGIHKFVEEKLPVLKENNITFIVNIAGESLEEYKQIAKICENNQLNAIELNLSCPNVEKGCLEFGKDEETICRLICSVREVFTGTLIVKLGTNVSFPEKIAWAVQKAGGDAISAINTVKAMNININSDYKGYKFIKGGLSGKCIKPIALNFIYEIRQHTDLPIIGMGGINNLNDILEFIAVGADAIQIGTGTFTQPDISEKLADELNDFMETRGYNSIKELADSLR